MLSTWLIRDGERERENRTGGGENGIELDIMQEYLEKERGEKQYFTGLNLHTYLLCL